MGSPFEYMDPESIAAMMEVDAIDREVWRAKQAAMAANYDTGGNLRTGMQTVLAVFGCAGVVAGCLLLVVLLVM